MRVTPLFQVLPEQELVESSGRDRCQSNAYSDLYQLLPVPVEVKQIHPMFSPEYGEYLTKFHLNKL